MAPKSINDLPVELHISILKYLLSLSRKPSSSLLPPNLPKSDCSVLPPTVKFEWTEEDTRSPSLFPFNVASVSRLWYNILALIPECWTRVVIDVAKDPTPLLDAFLWSENLENIEVLVFNSNNTEIVDKRHERSFVSAIAEALHPHIYRCKSIKFDLTYVTSLPPPMMFFICEAPYLEKLSLDCRIDNLGLLHDRMELGPQQDFATLFPSLDEISLTGFWFMYLVLHASTSDWLNHLSVSAYGNGSLNISHFTFPRKGPYSLPEFTSFLSKIQINRVRYYDLSLAYTYDGSEPISDFVCEIDHNQHFHAVSKDFITHLHALANFTSPDSMSFEACKIPKLKMTQPGDQLILTNIIDDDKGTSLRHIFEVWTGGDLVVCSCPSFNNTLLFWLISKIMYPFNSFDSPDPDIPFPAKYLNGLSVFDCDNFSSCAVREFMYFCSEASLVLLGLRRMELYVGAGCPILSDEDKEWFTENAKRMSVYWEITND